MTSAPPEIASLGVFVFPGVNALDVIGPFEVLCRLRGVDTAFVAPEVGSVPSDAPGVHFHATTSQTDRVWDVLLVPGGRGTDALIEDAASMEALGAACQRARHVLSVCTGAVAVARTGVFPRARATTHWAHRTQLDALGVQVSTSRTERDGRWWSAAGVSAGIDLALRFVGELYGPALAQKFAVAMEYDPEPPFGPGRLDELSESARAKMVAALTPRS